MVQAAPLRAAGEENTEREPFTRPVEPLVRAERGQARFFPVQALERALGGVCGVQLVRLLRVHHRQLDRLRSSGLTYGQADELAMRAGFHPSEIWREWTCPLLALVDVLDAGDPFDPVDEMGPCGLRCEQQTDCLEGTPWPSSP